MVNNNEIFEQVINSTYPGLTLYARDANLGELEERYTIGRIIREKGFTDATRRVGGLIATHRIAILSNHMADLSEYEHGTNWGLCVANRDSHFKILDVYKVEDKTQITLLHLPDDGWQIFMKADISLDKEVVQTARARFDAKFKMMPIMEVATEEWLQRCELPIGMDDDGNYFELECIPSS